MSGISFGMRLLAGAKVKAYVLQEPLFTFELPRSLLVKVTEWSKTVTPVLRTTTTVMVPP